jgi:hypothetical protein
MPKTFLKNRTLTGATGLVNTAGEEQHLPVILKCDDLRPMYTLPRKVAPTEEPSVWRLRTTAMAYEPLSSSTRNARTGILGFSSALIVVRTFHVTVESVPTAGFKISLGPELLPFILTAGLMYYVISFLIYVVDDLINATVASYTKEFVEESRKSLAQARSQFQNQLVGMLKRYVDIRDAENISRELKRFLFVIGEDREEFMRGRVEHELKLYLDRGVIKGDQFEEIAYNVVAHFRSIREEARVNEPSARNVRRYYYFRLVRTYGLEVGLPLVLAMFALRVLFNPSAFDVLRRVAAGMH